MKSIRELRILVFLVCVLLMASALAGLLFQEEGEARTVEAIDGRDVELFGRGTYANHSILRATSYMGADWTILVIVTPLLLASAAWMGKSPKGILVCNGALMIACYYSISLAFGAAFNRFFLLYIALFSGAGFTLGYSIYSATKAAWRQEENPQPRKWGTAIFLFVAGASALIWLSMIIPALVSGDFSEFIDVNTTEPTFVLDIGLVFPLFTICGVSLLKRKRFGSWFTPILLTFYSLVGAMVVMQTMVQRSFGIEIPLPQLVALVVSFISLGLIALALNIAYLNRHLKVEN